MIQIPIKCDTNTWQIDKNLMIYDTNTNQMWYNSITNRQKVCKKEGEPVKNLSNMFLRLAQYPQIKSSIYKLSLGESRKRKFNIISVNTCLKLNWEISLNIDDGYDYDDQSRWWWWQPKSIKVIMKTKINQDNDE